MTEEQYLKRSQEIYDHYNNRWEALDNFKTELNDYINYDLEGADEVRIAEAKNIREKLIDRIWRLWELRRMEMAKLDKERESNPKV